MSKGKSFDFISRRFGFHFADHFYSSQQDRHELANHQRII